MRCVHICDQEYTPYYYITCPAGDLISVTPLPFLLCFFPNRP